MILVFIFLPTIFLPRINLAENLGLFKSIEFHRNSIVRVESFAGKLGSARLVIDATFVKAVEIGNHELPHPNLIIVRPLTAHTPEVRHEFCSLWIMLNQFLFVIRKEIITTKKRFGTFSEVLLGTCHSVGSV